MKNKCSLTVLCQIIGMFLFIVSCSEKGPYQPPKFPETDSRGFEVIAEDLALGNTTSLFAYKNALIVCSYVPNGAWLRAYDANSGTLIATAIQQGRGPGEGLSLHAPYLDKEQGLLSFYDFYLQKILVVHLDELLTNVEGSSIELKPYIPMDRASAVIPAAGGGFLLCNYFTSYDIEAEEGLSRFMYFDEDENLVSEYSVWPEIGEVALMSLYAMPTMGISGDGKHWVVGTRDGAILEAFSFDRDKIQQDWIRYYYPTDMEEHLNDEGNSESVLGFGRICLTDDYIYSTVDFSHTVKQIVSKEFKNQPEALFSEVAVFSRKGKPVRLIKCGVRINEIAVDRGILYAIIENAKGEDCLARMKLDK